jgi:hypothetical protein
VCEEQPPRPLTGREVCDSEPQRVRESYKQRICEHGEREDPCRRRDERERLAGDRVCRERRKHERECDDGLRVGAAEAAERPEPVPERRDDEQAHRDSHSEEPVSSCERPPADYREREGQRAERVQRRPQPVREPARPDVPYRRPAEDGDDEQPERVRERHEHRSECDERPT